eukprot:GHUV01057574.1.p1 GENE.GHUV01057574.1~~GHUV01057574.1.p1  ORF type:complete len:696 (+),score=269.32 GHUV01057574.1:415-2502(+)
MDHLSVGTSRYEYSRGNSSSARQSSVGYASVCETLPGLISRNYVCCQWHAGEKARRRDPRMYNYLAIPCQETKEGKECPRGDDCPNCHSLFEYWLHPSRYRTQLCRNNDGNHCKRQICFFAHNIEELRVPDHSHLKIPEEIKQASAKKDTSNDAASDADTATDAAGSPKATSSSPKADAASSPKSAAAAAAAAQPRKDRRNSKGPLSKAALARLPVLDAAGSPTRSAPPAAAAGLPNGSTMAALLAGPYALGMPQPQGPAADGATALFWAQQQQLAALQNCCYQGPATPAAAARRAASLDINRLASDAPVTTAGRFSLDTACRTGQTISGANGMWASSSLFSNTMIADPEVPDPSNSPQSAARRASLLLQQQQMQQLLQNGRQEQQLDPAAVEQQLQVLMAQQQQQQLAQLAAANAGSRRGSYVDYTAAGGSRRGSYVDYSMSGSRRGSYVDYGSAGGSRRGSYVDYNAASRRGSYVDYAAAAASRRGSYVDYISGTGSPPLSPAASSMLGSGSSGLPDECQSVSSFASPYMSVPAPGWPPAPLHRAISGPAAFTATLPAISSGVPRYNSDSVVVTAAASQAPATAADLAAVRAQMELLGPQAMAAAAAGVTAGFTGGFCAEQLPVAAQTIPESLPVTASAIPEQSEAAEELNLGNVAELVNSVNRGELGSRGNEVLTGVIGLLMQQLQHQQLTA